ncbi:DNA polymerase III subunit gamma/tau [Asaia astilbis]|uniref:DNA polymerase III subunit gamma/tau n=1 Tax=Asaia astilbis TaxID=610244 RepID=UPI001E600ED2|nr:DNA polymerase III subunit gamma/tau [Asaia astilbis]
MAPPPQKPSDATPAPSATTERAGPYRVLARKYRPQHFDDLIGQDATVRILRRAFQLGRVAHAFMLTGVRGVGKTTTARIIARALNCIGVDGQGSATADPCGVCANCKAILADRHPDVLEMDAASRTGVDDIREIIEATRFRPMQGRMKVFIIDEVHMLSRNAFNALLKTLEEPPEQVTFIFATTELRKVPVTVLSRCQRFDLRRVPQEMLMQHFAGIAGKESVAFSDEALSLIARAADGSVRDGLSLLDQAIAQGEGEGTAQVEAPMVSAMLGLADRQLVFDLFEVLMQGKADQALQISGNAYAQGADLGVLLTDLLDLIHIISRLKAIPALRHSRELPEAERDRGASLADRLPNAELGRAWQILLKGVQEVEQAPERRAAAEMVLIRLCYASTLPTPDRLARLVMQMPADEANGSSPMPSGASTLTETSRGEAVTTSAHSNVPHGGASDGAGDDRPRASLRLVANGGVAYEAGAATLAPTPVLTPVPPPPESEKAEAAHPPLRSWREMVAFVARESEAMLHGMLRHSAHLIRFEPPRVVIRMERGTPPRTETRLQSLLERVYPGQWQIETSQEEGEPTLDEQGAEIVALRREELHAHPLLRAILDVFPDARVGEPKDLSLDEYGLPPEELEAPESWATEPPAPDLDFAPIDADLMDDDDWHDFGGGSSF